MQVEKAGGQSSGDGKGISGLDIKVEQHDQVYIPFPHLLVSQIPPCTGVSTHFATCSAPYL